MKTKTTAFLAAWLAIAFTFAYGQQKQKLSGTIFGAEQKPVDGASVYLVRAADSIMVKTAITEANGSFVFDLILKGKYRLTVQMVGFEIYKSVPFSLNKDTAISISLKPQGTALKEVTVTTTRPLIEHLIDRTVVNPEALISNAGGSAMDVLDKAPGVMVDGNGTISLKGKSGVTVFINDKPTYLSGEDLANYLRAIPSANIDRIELMPVPPAKYDAAGNAGVINIRMKHIKDVGFNGNFNAGIQQGHVARGNAGVNLNFRQNKLNVAANFSYFNNSFVNNLYINRYFDPSVTAISPNFLQGSVMRRHAVGYSGRISVDYYATDKTTFGIGLDGMSNPVIRNTASTSRLLNTQDQLDSTIVATDHQDRQFKDAGINLNVRHQFDKKGTELSFDADYIAYRTQTDQLYNNNSYYPNGALYYNNLLTGSLPSHVDIYALKSDFTHPFAKGIKLDAGLKVSYTQTDNTADYFNTVASVTKPDYSKTNHFIYQENINAAYINASRTFNRFSVQAGLRFENTVSNGHQLGNVQIRDSSFNRNYNSLFPTLYVQYKLDTTGQQVTFSYARRIDRPYYDDLNPFLSPIDKFTYYTGNPYLFPSYTNEYELTYTLHGITVTLDYAHIKNSVEETIEIQNGIYYSRPGNIGEMFIKEIDLEDAVDITKWLNARLYTSLSFTHSISNFYTGTLDTRGTRFYAQPVLTFKTGKDWTLQTEGGYQSKFTINQFLVGGRFRINAAIAKKLSASTTLKLAMNDITYNWINTGTINQLAGTKLANYRNLGDTRYLAASFTYRFGQTIKNQRTHDANAAQSEENRVKN